MKKNRDTIILDLSVILKEDDARQVLSRFERTTLTESERRTVAGAKNTVQLQIIDCFRQANFSQLKGWPAQTRQHRRYY